MALSIPTEMLPILKGNPFPRDGSTQPFHLKVGRGWAGMPTHPHHLLLVCTSLLIITPVSRSENLLKENRLNQVFLGVK